MDLYKFFSYEYKSKKRDFIKYMSKQFFNDYKFVNAIHILEKTSIFKKRDDVYTNYYRNIFLGFNSELLEKLIINKSTIVPIHPSNIKMGINLCIIETDSGIFTCLRSLVEMAEHIIDYLYLPRDYLSYYLISENILTIQLLDFWCVLNLNSNLNDSTVLQEVKLFKNMDNLLNKYICVDVAKTYDFNEINAEQFESLSREFLIKRGFQNVRIRGETNAPDGGVDIEADEIYHSVLGTQKRHWIFQCKNQKKQVDRHVITESRDLLKEFSADAYGIFYSNRFTPATLERVKKQDFPLVLYDKDILSDFLNEFPDISIKYFGY